MSRIGRDRNELGGSVWRSPVREEVEAELDFHFEMLVREHMERGQSRDDAERAARERFGDRRAVAARSLTSARDRDASIERRAVLDGVRQDVHFAWRHLRRSPLTSFLAVLTLAVGIGATTSIFTLLYHIVLRPFPFASPERVVYVAERYNGASGSFSIGNFVDVARQSKSFEALGALAFLPVTMNDGQDPQRVLGARTTSDVFRVLGIAPILGRVFTSDEDVPGKDAVVVLSHALWTSHFAGDSGVVGREVRLNGLSRRIIGVMPATFDPILSGEQLWIPAAFTPAERGQHDEHYIDVVGLLRRGVTHAQAGAELAPIMQELVLRYPNANIGRSIAVEDYGRLVVGPVRERLFVLFGAVVLVLLLACTNVAGLLLARAAVRAKELAIRTAIGAGRGRVVRQLLTESAVLAMVASVAGLALSWAMLRGLVAIAPPYTPRLEGIGIDLVPVAFASVVGLASALFAGALPAWRATGFPPQQVLREGGRSGGQVRDRVRSALVAGEVALALSLCVGAALLVRSAMAVQRIAPGFDPRGVVMGRLSLPALSYREPNRIVQALEAMVETLEGMPGITGAAATSQAPLGPGGGSNGLLVAGRTPTAENLVDARLRFVTPNYLQVMGIPLRSGRTFTDLDVSGAPRVMIVSEATARRLWPGRDPLGEQVLCCEGSEEDPRAKTVVGVAGDVRSSGLGADVSPEFYLPMRQVPDVAWDWVQRSLTLVSRGATDPSATVSAMRTAVRRVDPSIPLDRVAGMSELLHRSTAVTRFNTLLLTVLGAVGGLLAAVGIFGVVSFFVGARTQEIGVRRALGARDGSIIALFAWQGLRPVLVGAVVGLGSAAAGSRLLSSVLVGVSPSDPIAYAAALAAIVLVGIAASVVPARRALRVQPTEALQG